MVIQGQLLCKQVENIIESRTRWPLKLGQFLKNIKFRSYITPNKQDVWSFKSIFKKNIKKRSARVIYTYMQWACAKKLLSLNTVFAS